MGRADQKLRRRRWEKDHHCYWCGVPTVWFDKDGGRQPANAATLDHIRSRYTPQRAQQSNGRWRRGIIVLACYQCNQDRCQQEQAFLSREKIGLLQKQSGNFPSHPRLRKLQTKLATAVVKFLENGGDLVGKHSGHIREMALSLGREYEKKRRHRQLAKGTP